MARRFRSAAAVILATGLGLVGCSKSSATAADAAPAIDSGATVQMCGACGVRRQLADGQWTPCTPEPLLYPCPTEHPNCVQDPGCTESCDFVCSGCSSADSSCTSAAGLEVCSGEQGARACNQIPDGVQLCTCVNGSWRDCGSCFG